MPRAFDITPRRKSPPPTPQPTAPTRRRSRRRSSGAFAFILLLIIAGAVLFYSQSLGKQGTNSAQPTGRTTTANTSTNSAKPNSTSENVTNKEVPAGKPKIQVLNGTGVESITDNIKKVLEDNGYPVSSASQAKYEYKETYIHYRPESTETAKAISTMLAPYKPSLSESQISGLFDILIIIGKENLPPAT